MTRAEWLALTLATLAAGLALRPAFTRAWHALEHRIRHRRHLRITDCLILDTRADLLVTLGDDGAWELTGLVIMPRHTWERVKAAKEGHVELDADHRDVKYTL